MRRLVDQALGDESFVRFAIDLVRSVPPYDDAGELAAVFSWVQSQIRYTKDPVSKEKLYPPQELLKIKAGDCDDMSMLLGALALALGYPARIVTVSASPESPREFSHVYVEAEAPPGSGRWIALDTARSGSHFGLQPEVYFRKRVWSLIDDSYQDMKGLSGYCQLQGLGDNGDGIDWGSILSQTLTETPQIISAVQGTPTQLRLPSGASVSTGPYSSFATPYTPGYGSPAAGYGPGGSLPLLSSTAFSAFLPWLLVGVVAIAVFKR
jgi:hypothetical protein